MIIIALEIMKIDQLNGCQLNVFLVARTTLQVVMFGLGQLLCGRFLLGASNLFQMWIHLRWRIIYWMDLDFINQSIVQINCTLLCQAVGLTMLETDVQCTLSTQIYLHSVLSYNNLFNAFFVISRIVHTT